MSGPLKKVNANLDSTKRSSDRLKESLNDLGRSNNRLARDTEKSKSSLKGLGGVFSTLKKSVTGGFGFAAGFGIFNVMTGGIKAAAGALESSTNKAIEFEAQMKTIQALTGASNKEMTQMQALALQQGAITKYSALEAAQGIEELLKAGITPAQVQAGALNAALNLATAGGLDLAEAAEIMSTSLNAFKKDALSAAQTADILAGTANASATDVHDLRYSLAAVGAVADQVGLSFKDTNIALGLFANNGIKGSDAGTSLKSMLMNLTPATKAATENFKKLGLQTKKGANEFFDAKGNLKPLEEIADILQTTFKGMTAAQRQLELKNLFGTDGIRAATILYKEGAAGVKKFRQEMSNVTALSVAKTKMDSAAGAVEQFRGALETLQISALLPTMPIIKNLALQAADFVAKYTPQITAAVQGMVDKASAYVKTHFTNNPEFQKIPTLTGKIAFIFDDLMKAFTSWWDGGGRETMKNATARVVGFMAEVLKATAPEITSAAISLGTAIANGVMEGIKEHFNPLAFMNGKMKAREYMDNLKGYDAWKDSTPADKPLIQGKTYLTAPPEKKGFFASLFGKSGGLDNVPYNSYPARLHQGEAVLTRPEAKEWRENGKSIGGSGGPSVVVTGNTFHVRNDGDIDAIADSLARRLAM